MRQRLRRGILWLMLALSGATLFQTATTGTGTTNYGFTGQTGAFGGCNKFITNGLLTPIDFCYILDCQSGFLGGAVQPCGTPPMLVDCPTTTGSTTGTTGTSTGT